MSSPPIALGPSAVPATSNLFNSTAANQPQWDRFLLSCHLQNSPGTGSAKSSMTSAPRTCQTQCVPLQPCLAVPSVNHVVQRGHLRTRGHLGHAGGLGGELCVWLFGLIVGAFSANFSGGTFPSLLCCHQRCHSGIQPHAVSSEGFPSFACLIPFFPSPATPRFPLLGHLDCLVHSFLFLGTQRGGDNGCNLRGSTCNQSPEGACCCLPVPRSGFRAGLALI